MASDLIDDIAPPKLKTFDKKQKTTCRNDKQVKQLTKEYRKIQKKTKKTI